MKFSFYFGRFKEKSVIYLNKIIPQSIGGQKHIHFSILDSEAWWIGITQ